MIITLFTTMKILYIQNGKKIGTNAISTVITRKVNGTPILTKSLKLYPPGATTIVLIGDETGVIKEADVAIATVIANGYGE